MRTRRGWVLIALVGAAAIAWAVLVAREPVPPRAYDTTMQWRAAMALHGTPASGACPTCVDAR